MSNELNSANKVLTKSGLNTPPWRKLRGGAHLHATKGYRVSRSNYRVRHAGVVDDPGTGGLYRAAFKRPRVSYAQNLLAYSHTRLQEFLEGLVQSVVFEEAGVAETRLRKAIEESPYAKAVTEVCVHASAPYEIVFKVHGKKVTYQFKQDALNIQ